MTELRRKEADIQRDLADGVDYAAGEITVAELVDRFINLKRGLKQKFQAGPMAPLSIVSTPTHSDSGRSGR